MGLFVNQQDQRSELQEANCGGIKREGKSFEFARKATMDGVEDIRYLEGTKQTTTLAWAWILIAIMAGAVIVMFLMQGR